MKMGFNLIEKGFLAEMVAKLEEVADAIKS
jgi:hypothetical protein